MPFDTKNAIILPRQARNKHRESTQKRDAFSQDSFDLALDGDAPPPPPAVGGQQSAPGVDEDDMVEV